jgi:hypothetical protein
VRTRPGTAPTEPSLLWHVYPLGLLGCDQWTAVIGQRRESQIRIVATALMSCSRAAAGG